MLGADLLCETRAISADAVLAHAWDAVIVLAPDGGRLFASPSIERITGYSPEEYLRLPPGGLCHPDDRPLVERSLRACLDDPTQRPVYAHRVRHRDGTWRHVEAVATNALADPAIGGIVINARDVTELEGARAALRRSERRLRNAFIFAGIGKAIVGMDGTWLEVNPAVTRITGYGEDELRRMTFQQITHPDDLDTDLELAARLARGEISAYELDKRYIRKDGSIAWVRLTGSMVRDDAGRPEYFIAQIQDISEQKRLEKLLRYRAEHDGLTGVLGRAAFVERLRLALERFDPVAPPALALIDLDDFKQVNDTRGHLVGDAILTAIAERIRRAVPGATAVGRWGGDEFVALFSSLALAQEAVRRIEAELAFPIPADDGRIIVSASIGIAVATRGETPERLLRAADAAMYRAKRCMTRHSHPIAAATNHARAQAMSRRRRSEARMPRRSASATASTTSA